MPIVWDLNRRVIIRNLGDTPTKSEIRALFGNYGVINKLWVARNPPGFAFLEYTRRRDAEKAVKALNGEQCCGCRIEVELTADLSHTPYARRSRSKQATSGTREKFQIKRKDQQRDSESSHSRSSEHIAQRIDCSICFHNVLENEPTVSKCGHVFCGDCIRQSLLRNRRCPICRADVEENQLIRIYVDS